jgi:hypothetical protein
MADLQPVKALYYPHIQFASFGWLRTALLYWEGILRIVPDGFEPWDPPEVYELAAAGLIENVSPTRYLKAAREAFAPRLQQLLLEKRDGSLGVRRESGTLVHIAELEPELLQELQSQGLATAAGDWASMAPEIASLYKAILATEAGRELHAPPATDAPQEDLASSFFFAKQLSRNGRVLIDGFAWARDLDPFPRIERRPLSTDKVLEIRQSYVSQRRAFRERVQVRLAAIDSLPSVAAVASHLNDFATEIDGEKLARRRALQSSGVRNAWALLKVSAPAALGAAVTLAGAPLLVAAAGVAGSAALGVTDWLVQRHHERRDSGHYLLSLEETVPDRAFRPRRSGPAPLPLARGRERE